MINLFKKMWASVTTSNGWSIRFFGAELLHYTEGDHKLGLSHYPVGPTWDFYLDGWYWDAPYDKEPITNEHRELIKTRIQHWVKDNAAGKKKVSFSWPE